METIEDAAREHCNIKKDLIIDEEERYYKDFQKYDGFKAGAEFAQRWISVEEELPTELENVLFKSEYEGEVLYEVGFLFSGKFYVKNKMPTHWRPIELK